MALVPRGPLGKGLTEAQQARLSQLETVQHPTPWSRGELAALRICAITDAEQGRIAALDSRWAERHGA